MECIDILILYFISQLLSSHYSSALPPSSITQIQDHVAGPPPSCPLRAVGAFILLAIIIKLFLSYFVYVRVTDRISSMI